MSKLERFAEAYKMMAELGYRPAAPSDGFGGITVPYVELEVDIEAREYAQRFAAEEETDRARIVRGLYYHVAKAPLAKECEI